MVAIYQLLNYVVIIQCRYFVALLYGELGFIPPSVDADIMILCYYNRLRHLPCEKLVRRAFDCLMYLWLFDALSEMTK